MTGIEAAAAAAAGSILVSLALSGVVAWAGPVDPPDFGAGSRTSHAQPTPTSGGLAILAGTSIGAALFAALSSLHLPEAGRLAAVLAFAGALGLLGALDDLCDIGARAKLVVQAALALAFAVVVARIQALPVGFGLAIPLGPAVGALGSALWIVVVTNAVNFMDGADGVAPGAMVVALGALALAAAFAHEPALAALALAGAAAGAGLLPWNLGRRLFQGDAGALFSSFLFAALCLLATGPDAGRPAPGEPVGLYFGPLALLPFLTDVLLTLLWRARQRRPLLQAHRDHLYQLWLQQTGRSHAALALRVAAIMLACGVAALALQRAPAGLQPPLFAIAVVVTAAGWTLARRRLGVTGSPLS